MRHPMIAAVFAVFIASGCAGAPRPENVAEVADEREGELCVTPAAFDFGRVHIGNVANGVMRLRNDGAGDIDIRSVVVSPSAPLRTWLSSPSVGPGTGTLLDVSYTPTAPAAHKAAVVITYRTAGAGDQTLTIPITGQGG